jgi:PAS domain S-box-containing protein
MPVLLRLPAVWIAVLIVATAALLAVVLATAFWSVFYGPTEHQIWLIALLVAVPVATPLAWFMVFIVGELNRQTIANESRGRQRAESLLGRLINASRDEIYVLDAKTLKILEANLGARAQLGYTADELMNLTLPDVIPEAHRADLNALVAQLFSNDEGNNVAVFEINQQRKDGTTYPVEMRLQASDVEGEPILIATAQDITTRLSAWSELRQAKDEAEISNKTKSVFLAHMSHELRTPLNAIIGFAEVLDNEMFGPLGNEHYKAYAHDIYESGRHLLEIIGDLIDISRIEAGEQSLTETMVDVERLVEACVRLTAPRAYEVGLHIEKELPAGLPSIHGDEVKLKQILLNLLTNAVKFTAPGGTVTIAVQHNPLQDLRFVISDTGIGIDTEDIPKALSWFQRLRAAEIGSADGAGLGLPLAKSLTELHDGHLILESAKGIGTKVTVSLPATRLHSPALASQAVAEDARRRP